MRKFVAFALVFSCVLGLVGCSSDERGSVKDDATDSCTFVVMDVTESKLLVAEIGEGGKAIETRQYSVPNWFYPSTEIKVGYKITIKHSGAVLETFPMQFAEIYSMEYWNRETGLSTIVTVD